MNLCYSAIKQRGPYTNDQFDLFTPIFLNVTDPERRKEIGKSMEKFYFNGKSINDEEALELVSFYFLKQEKFHKKFREHAVIHFLDGNR